MTKSGACSRIPRPLLAEAAAEVGGELEFFAVARVTHEPEAAGAVDLQARLPEETWRLGDLETWRQGDGELLV